MEDEFKEYTKPIGIQIDDVVLGWNPSSEMLSPLGGEDAVLVSENIENFIKSTANYEESIMVTPEGPSLPATIKNLYTVVWAIDTIYGDDTTIKYIGDAPTMADMGLDPESNVDKDGLPVVR